jgi:Transglutaminase-like superfamily
MKNWWNRFIKWRALPWSGQWLLLRVTVCIVLVKLGLKLLPFKQFKAVYDRLVSNVSAQTYESKFVDQLVWSVRAVSNALPVEVLCLPQALAVKFFLRAEPGYELKIGVSNHDRLFSAHAWVAKADRIIIGEIPNIHYVPLWAWS